LRTAPGIVQATDFPRADVVEYQVFPPGVLAQTTEDFATFEIFPGCAHAVPALNAAFFFFGVALLSPHDTKTIAAVNTRQLVNRKPLTRFMTTTFERSLASRLFLRGPP
jgi:hypothetical protein